MTQHEKIDLARLAYAESRLAYLDEAYKAACIKNDMDIMAYLFLQRSLVQDEIDAITAHISRHHD